MHHPMQSKHVSDYKPDYTVCYIIPKYLYAGIWGVYSVCVQQFHTPAVVLVKF